MHKKTLFVGTLMLALALVALQAGAVRAIPPLPCTFWGTVTVDGVEASYGTVVSAWSGNVKWAETQMRWADGATGRPTFYSVDVPADDPETPKVEGLKAGEAVQFRIFRPTVGGLPAVANQAGIWQSNTTPELNLTATQPVPACVIHLPQAGRSYRWGAGS